MAALDDFPGEILRMIFDYAQYFEPRENIRCLRNACLVNTRWRAFAQPYLFNTWIEHWQYDHSKQTLPFIRTLLARPDLANAVTWISLDNYVWNLDSREPQTQADGELLDAILRAAEHYRPEHRAWHAAIRGGEKDATLALLIYLLPNLEVMEICLPYSEDEHIFGYWVLRFAEESLSESASKDGPGFMRKVRRVLPRHWDTEYGFDMGAIAPLLFSSEMREVEAWAVDRCTDLTLNKDWATHTSEVKTLRLLFSGLENADFDRLINSFRSLEVLEWEWGSSTQNGHVISMQDLGWSLRRSCSTSLRRLFIDASDCYWAEYGELEEDDCIGSLVAFTQLTDLTLSAIFFFGSDEYDEVERSPLFTLLPASLENLCIIGWSFRLVSELEALIVAREEGRLPHLKKVTLTGWERHSDQIPAIALDAFDGKGIDCSYVDRLPLHCNMRTPFGG